MTSEQIQALLQRAEQWLASTAFLRSIESEQLVRELVAAIASLEQERQRLDNENAEWVQRIARQAVTIEQKREAWANQLQRAEAAESRALQLEKERDEAVASLESLAWPHRVPPADDGGPDIPAHFRSMAARLVQSRDELKHENRKLKERSEASESRALQAEARVQAAEAYMAEQNRYWAERGANESEAKS